MSVPGRLLCFWLRGSASQVLGIPQWLHPNEIMSHLVCCVLQNGRLSTAKRCGVAGRYCSCTVGACETRRQSCYFGLSEMLYPKPAKPGGLSIIIFPCKWPFWGVRHIHFSVRQIHFLHADIQANLFGRTVWGERLLSTLFHRDPYH